LPKTPFFKYQGTGNDFILIEDPESTFPDTHQELVASLCHRRLGIGADGLILLRLRKDHKLEMVYYNSDGRLASMCGNGGRCFAHFAWRKGYAKSREVNFVAADGWHTAHVNDDRSVSLTMQSAKGIQKHNSDLILNTGSHHYLVFQDLARIQAKDVVSAGSDIRYASSFKAQGINVNFIEVQSPNVLYVRTYERGVENETLSCGTGVVAAALGYAYKEEKAEGPVHVETKGGMLTIHYHIHSFHPFEASSIIIDGPVGHVFDGFIPLNQ
jgi:diaminopimelate epimerase